MAFSKRILDEAKGKTIAVAADDMGLRLFDIKNLKAGNRPSMDMLIRLVHTGRYAPNYLLFNQGSRKLRTNVSVRGAQVRNIHQRLRNALRARPAQELAAESGLPIQSIYQYRVDGRRPGLHIFLGLVLTGLSPNSLLLGRAHR